MAYLIVQARIRRKLAAARASRPAFSSSNEFGADALPSSLRDDIPALEIANTIRAAGIHDIANRELHEADGVVGIVECQEHLRGFVMVAREKALRVAAVLIEGRVRP